MAWTGLPATIEVISDKIVRITGLSLAAGAADTIGFTTGAGTVTIPADVQPKPYAIPANALVTLIAQVTIYYLPVTAVTVFPAVQVVKTGATLAAFLATFTNGGAAASGGLEIYFKLHD